MKSNASTPRLSWPRTGVAVRVPPRRLAAAGVQCELIPFNGTVAQTPRRHAWDALATGLPRGAPVVLLVAAEDVSFTAADVPSLTGMRLREALPNLVEEKTVGDVGSLHVALGLHATEGRGRTLAVIDRAWLAAMQVHVLRAGHRVAAIVPESLAVPLRPETWSLACVVGEVGGEVDGAMRCWLRLGTQQAIALPDDVGSAIAIASASMRAAPADERPTTLLLHAAPTVAVEARAFATTIAAALALTLDASDTAGPFAAWLAGQGPDGGYGAPLSLLAFDRSAVDGGWRRWRLAAALAVAIVAVQIIGMQWEWARLRREAAGLRQQATTIVTSAFPETRIVLDAPLQMARGLAGLRASAGNSDPGDFSTMLAASARILAGLPSNALRGADYDTRTLRLRFAPGSAMAADERDRLAAAALQEGYQLRFDAAVNAAGEASASLKTRGAAT